MEIILSDLNRQQWTQMFEKAKEVSEQELVQTSVRVMQL